MRALIVVLLSVGGAALLVSGAAWGRSPQPDRPFLTKTGDLAGGIETEVGASWQGDSVSTPLRVKVGAGWFEPRVQADLAGLGTRRPGVVAGVKFAAVQQQALGLAGYAESAVPLVAAEDWSSEVGGALSLRTDRGLQMRFNLGLALAGSGGQVTLAGAPLRTLFAVPLGDALLPFAEAEASLGDGLPAWSLGAGLGWQPLDSLVLDAGVGWDLDVDAPRVQAGLTFNAGSAR